MSEILLSCQRLSARAGEKEILHGIDLQVPHGEAHVLVGPNGAGKSTLGHVLMGDPAYETTAGTITFDGQDITELSPDKRSHAG
ncbi:MAG: ATP-binding cassette domain-containing protein, partial [Eggerthellaceae bacterium]|nr:ATP-binding cassette domain-containing protein [Eggerthellaceae bacterium]